MNKEYNQVKAGLVNYTGAMLKATTFESDKAARQFVAASLIEEALKLMHDENDKIDMYVAKPLLRAISFLLLERADELEKVRDLIGHDIVKARVSKYEDIAIYLKKIADGVNE